MRTLYIIRHGEVAFPDGKKRCIGRTDLPLSDAGRRHGEALRAYFAEHPIEAVYASPLRRAKETARILADAGWRIGNVSVQMQAQRPKFAPRRAEAEAALTAALGAPVSVSATTTDGLGFTGRTEGVQVFAVAMIVPA